MKKKSTYGAKIAAVATWLNEFPDAADTMIAKEVGCHPTYAILS